MVSTHSNSDIFTYSVNHNDTVAFDFVEEVMATINKKLICNKCQSFYNAIENPNGCQQCKKVADKTYDKQLRAKDRQKIYNSKRWKQVRDYVRVRDNFLCQECLRNGIETIGVECDHMVELSDDISKAYDADNVELLCVSCHRKKSELEKQNRIKK